MSEIEFMEKHALLTSVCCWNYCGNNKRPFQQQQKHIYLFWPTVHSITEHRQSIVQNTAALAKALRERERAGMRTKNIISRNKTSYSGLDY